MMLPSRWFGRLAFACAFLGVLASPAPAGAQPASAGVAPLARAVAAYRARDFARSGPLFLAAAESAEDPAGAYYNAACSFALAGQREPAFAALARAVDAGYADAEHAGRDPDLASLRADARWRPLLDRAAARAKADRDFWDGPALRAPYRADLSADEKVAGLSKLWAEAKFNFVHFGHVPALAWDSLYLATLPAARATTSTRDYYRVLQAFYARLGDGHTGVSLPRELAAETGGRPLVRTVLLEGRVAVREAASSLRALGLAPGVEVTAVDGEPVAAYAARAVAPYVSASTPQDRDARVYGPALLQGAEGTPVALALRDARGRTREVRVPRVGAAAYRRAFDPAPMTLRMLPGGVAHVALNTFVGGAAADAFVAALPELARARALVLDVRENDGGNSNEGYRVLAALAERPFATSRWTTRDYRPAFRSWGRREGRYVAAPDTVPPGAGLPRGAPRFAGPVVVLTGPRTYSAAEDFVAAFRGMRRGRVVGEATGGSTGNPVAFPLPGGGWARVCSKHDVAPDGTEFVGVGFKPDVLVPATLAELRGGRDAALAAAAALLAPR